MSDFGNYGLGELQDVVDPGPIGDPDSAAEAARCAPFREIRSTLARKSRALHCDTRRARTC